MKKLSKLVVLVFVCSFILTMCLPVSARSVNNEYRGIPTEYQSGHVGYFIWQDKNDNWYLRTNTSGKNHRFSGTIRTDGVISRENAADLETNDSIQVDSDKNKIKFSFRSAKDIDGMNIRIRDYTYIEFDLYIDGRPAHTNGIYLGRNNLHPSDNRFRLYTRNQHPNDDYEYSNKYYEGQPTRFMPGFSNGDFIWHDNGGWHLRTTTYLFERHFVGEIRTDGEFRNVRSVENESRDRVTVDYRRDIIRFDFNTARGIDGVDFQVERASYIEFNLTLDGEQVSTSRVYIGSHNTKPHESPFRIIL